MRAASGEQQNAGRGAVVRTVLSNVLALAMLSVFAYLTVRTALFLTADYLWYEKLLAFFLLLAEVFTMLHAFGYFLNLRMVISRQAGPRISVDNVPELASYPPVAIIVSSFREPLDVLEDTLTCFYNLTYPNKRIYFLDDTRYGLPGQDAEAMAKYRADVDSLCQYIGIGLFRRAWRGAKAGMINDLDRKSTRLNSSHT